MKRLIIIDLSNFIFRAFFAIRPLHTPQGVPVNAVYGVLSMLYNMLTEHKPTHILIARDTKEGSFRKEIYKEYKAHRTEPPDDLKPQFEIVDKLLEVLKLPEIKMSGYEADDIIGSAVTKWKNEFDEILIASGDKDLMQFVGGPVQILDTMKDKTYSREDVKDKMGVYPEQIVDFLSLVGDSSDNIPGVAGIGPKGAQNLIEEFGTLEEILKNIPYIKNKRSQAALEAHLEDAKLSKKLVQIVTDLNFKLNHQDCSFQLVLRNEAIEFLDNLGFKSWLTKLAPFKTKNEFPAKEISSFTSNIKNVHHWNLKEFQDILDRNQIISCVDLRGSSIDQFSKWPSVVVASDDKVGIINFNGDDSYEFFEKLNSYSGMIVCYQSKPLLQFSLVNKINPTFKYFDLSQAHFLINPEYKHDQLTILEEFLNLKLDKSEGQQLNLLGNISDDETLNYARIASANLKLYEILLQKMRAFGVEEPYINLDIPLIKVLSKMELEGVTLDVEIYRELEKQFSMELGIIENEIYLTAGDKINLRSPKQVGELLFEKLNLPVVRKTKTGYSTDADVLNELAAMQISPIPELLLRHRELEKLLSTYVRTLPEMVNPVTKKIHTHFQPSNAATGRLSSDHPNLQNIPVRTENGRKLRKGFIPTKGRILLSADYSQVELRLLAHFSQDTSMLEAFKNKLDIHKQTAAEIFNVKLDQVTKDQRNSAKAINFGLMYGQTSFGLSQALKISQAEAKKYITNYFQKFNSVKIYLDSLKEKAEQTGYAETFFGRKRMLPNIKSTNRQIKAMAERMAINSPIQGTAADIIKLAMINIQRELEQQNLKTKMILQVHDELIFDVAMDELELMRHLVRDKMENAVQLSVPLEVEMGTGYNWYDLK